MDIRKEPVTLYSRVPGDVKRRVEFEAYEQRRDMQDIILEALQDYFRKVDAAKGKKNRKSGT